MLTARGRGSASGGRGLLPGGRPPWMQTPLVMWPVMHTEKPTPPGACENITFRQTSFAGGKNPDIKLLRYVRFRSFNFCLCQVKPLKRSMCSGGLTVIWLLLLLPAQPFQQLWCPFPLSSINDSCLKDKICHISWIPHVWISLGSWFNNNNYLLINTNCRY